MQLESITYSLSIGEVAALLGRSYVTIYRWAEAYRSAQGENLGEFVGSERLFTPEECEKLVQVAILISRKNLELGEWTANNFQRAAARKIVEITSHVP
jgi:transposase